MSSSASTIAEGYDTVGGSNPGFSMHQARASPVSEPEMDNERARSGAAQFVDESEMALDS
jgi:hypothetical protein